MVTLKKCLSAGSLADIMHLVGVSHNIFIAFLPVELPTDLNTVPRSGADKTDVFAFDFLFKYDFSRPDINATLSARYKIGVAVSYCPVNLFLKPFNNFVFGLIQSLGPVPRKAAGSCFIIHKLSSFLFLLLSYNAVCTIFGTKRVV
jgi:hypothetical protein